MKEQEATWVSYSSPASSGIGSTHHMDDTVCIPTLDPPQVSLGARREQTTPTSSSSNYPHCDLVMPCSGLELWEELR